MRNRGSGSVVEPWVCDVLVIPGSRAGDALCPVILQSIMDGACCKTTESRPPGERLSIWEMQCVFH